MPKSITRQTSADWAAVESGNDEKTRSHNEKDMFEMLLLAIRTKKIEDSARRIAKNWKVSEDIWDELRGTKQFRRHET